MWQASSIVAFVHLYVVKFMEHAYKNECYTVFYVLSAHDVLSAHPLFGQSYVEGYLYM